jgi:hypothetical protein
LDSTSVADPHHFYADVDPDLDSACHFDADADPDPDPTFHFYGFLIRILASKVRLKTLKKCSNKLIFHTLRLVIFKLMRILIRIQLITLLRMGMRIRIQLITLMRILKQIRILPFTSMRIHADPDPQHWLARRFFIQPKEGNHIQGQKKV